MDSTVSGSNREICHFGLLIIFSLNKWPVLKMNLFSSLSIPNVRIEPNIWPEGVKTSRMSAKVNFDLTKVHWVSNIEPPILSSFDLFARSNFGRFQTPYFE